MCKIVSIDKNFIRIGSLKTVDPKFSTLQIKRRSFEISPLKLKVKIVKKHVNKIVESSKNVQIETKTKFDALAQFL